MKFLKNISLGMISIFFISQMTLAATISGKISFEGAPPEQEKIKMEADPICHMQHSKDIFTEKFVLNANGTLKNVLVSVKEGLGGQKFEVPGEPVLLDQRECQYKPHIFGVQAGQTLKILNSDDTLHNVHCKTRQASLFNLAMPFKGLELEQKFDQADMVKFVCEVHPWMNAYAGVFRHPFFGVSNEEGTFEIKNLPAGTYVIEAWHERGGSQTQSVTVTQDETKTLDFTFKAQ